MKIETPRLRIFAGPNGSGKSTIKSVVNKELVGQYIDPDEIEKDIIRYDFINFNCFEIETNEKEVLSFFKNSSLLNKVNLHNKVECLKYHDDKLYFSNICFNGYFASVCVDFITKKLLEKQRSFSFKTVMSSYDNIELLKLAKQYGYRTYLYFIATDDSSINISRVKQRVKIGGYDVPSDKIVSRYNRSLENLWSSIEQTNRAYIFDNSSHSHSWLCEITEAKEVLIKKDNVPKWFYKYVIDKIDTN